jgi:flavin-dependent dehydrogenase
MIRWLHALTRRRFDVAIIGAGPAGAVTALVLARTGVRVLLAERHSREVFKVGEGLPPAARPLLRDLNLADQLDADDHLPSFGNESAWGSSLLRSTDFIRDPNGLGWHLDRARFDAMMRYAALDAGAHVLESTIVNQVDRDATRWRLRLICDERPFEIEASWLVDSSGRRSWLARRRGAVRLRSDRLLGFVAVFCRNDRDAPADVDSMTLVESAPDGWWYSSRLSTNRRVVVYLTDAHGATARRARTPEGYRALLQETTHTRERVRNRGYSNDGACLVVSADTSRLDRCTGDGWLAAGDAAASFDPLSSQGILSAMYSGLKAGRTLRQCLDGDAHAAHEYGDALDAVYAAYLQRRYEYYRLEQRWAAHDFWRSRQAAE